MRYNAMQSICRIMHVGLEECMWVWKNACGFGRMHVGLEECMWVWKNAWQFGKMHENVKELMRLYKCI